MKVVNITEEGRFGGPQRRILEVAKVLKSAYNIETIVVLPNYDSERFQEAMKAANVAFYAISIHRFTKNIPHLIKAILFFIPEVWRLMQIMKKESADIVHINGSWQIKGVIAAYLAGVKNVWHLNDTSAPRPIKMLFNLLATLMGDGFISSSNRTTNYYIDRESLKKKPLQLVRPPVDTKKFTPDSIERSSKLDEFDGVRILSVGNVGPYKGYDTYIRAAALVNQKLPNKDVHFYIAGKLFKTQQKVINDLEILADTLGVKNLTFLGETKNIPEVLKSSDIFVCSSVAEAGPMSVFEAMMMKKPIVSTDVGDVKALFEIEDCGIVVPVGDNQGLAEGIIRIIEDTNYGIQIGQLARNTALNHLDVKHCANAHQLIYRQIAQDYARSETI